MSVLFSCTFRKRGRISNASNYKMRGEAEVRQARGSIPENFFPACRACSAERAPGRRRAGESLLSVRAPAGRLCQRFRGPSPRPAAHGIATTSSPARVTRRAKMRMSMSAFRKCTEPSAKTAFTPAG